MQCSIRKKKTIIMLSSVTLERSFKHGEEADLCLAMGSSLTVTPAANIPEVMDRKCPLPLASIFPTFP